MANLQIGSLNAAVIHEFASEVKCQVKCQDLQTLFWGHLEDEIACRKTPKVAVPIMCPSRPLCSYVKA